jgi:hypothetical protein
MRTHVYTRTELTHASGHEEITRCLILLEIENINAGILFLIT